MTKVTFAIDLTKYDISEYEKNPIVSYNFDYTSPPIGRGKVAEDKKSVEIEFLPRALSLFADTLSGIDTEIAPALQENKLIDLSIVPKKKDDGAV